jgi:hypothetical protein
MNLEDKEDMVYKYNETIEITAEELLAFQEKYKSIEVMFGSLKNGGM